MKAVPAALHERQYGRANEASKGSDTSRTGTTVRETPIGTFPCESSSFIHEVVSTRSATIASFDRSTRITERGMLLTPETNGLDKLPPNTRSCRSEYTSGALLRTRWFVMCLNVAVEKVAVRG